MIRFYRKFKKWIIGLLIPTALASTLILGNNSPAAEFVTAPENNLFQIGKMNYEYTVTDNELEYRLGDKYIKMKPIGLRWNKQKTNFKTYVPNGKRRDKIFNDIFGLDTKLELRTGGRRWQKLVQIDSLSAFGRIPNNATYLEFVFEIDTNFVIDGWNRKDRLNILETTRLGDYSYIDPALAWDSYEEQVCETVTFDDGEQEVFCDTLENKIKINSYVEDNLYVKQIPVDWLKNAQYPIFTDADITFGTEATMTTVTGNPSNFTTAEIGTDKFVTCLIDNEGNDAVLEGKCIVGSVSGTTISYGSLSEYYGTVYTNTHGAGEVDACKLDDDKFAVVYTADDLADDGYAVAVTVSGTTIGTWGTAVEIETGDTEQQNCAQLDIDKFVSCYNDETDSDTAKCVVNTVSGTTITAGTPTEVNASVDYKPFYGSTAKLSTDKFVNCFAALDDTNDGQCVVATVSGTTITMGTVEEFDTGGLLSAEVDALDASTFVVSFNGFVSFDGWSVAATVSGTTITDGTAVAFELGTGSTNDPSSPVTIGIDSDNFVVGWADDGDLDKGNASYSSISGTTITHGAEEYFTTDDILQSQFSVSGAKISSRKIVFCYMNNTDGDGQCIVGTTPAESAARRVFITQ